MNQLLRANTNCVAGDLYPALLVVDINTEQQGLFFMFNMRNTLFRNVFQLKLILVRKPQATIVVKEFLVSLKSIAVKYKSNTDQTDRQQDKKNSLHLVIRTRKLYPAGVGIYKSERVVLTHGKCSCQLTHTRCVCKVKCVSANVYYGYNIP